MSVPNRVTQWVNDQYRRPRVDPDWLIQCYEWLTREDGGHDPDTDLQGLLHDLETQVLESDLSDSMLPGTGLPTHVGVATAITTLNGPHILVEIASITEIAHSAFHLNQTRMAIEERMKDGNVDDAEGEGDIEVEGEGPMPKYSRGMLEFHLTDGTTTLQAIEYRSLPDMSLEKTPLGSKMLLKDVRIHRGVAFLEPKCVTFLGHKTIDRDENRAADFARGLRVRMGLPEPPVVVVENGPAPPVNQPHDPHQIRSPLREISPPPSPTMFHNDDEDLEPRRRRIPSRTADDTPLSTGATLVPSRSVPPPSRGAANTSSYFGPPKASGSAAINIRPTNTTRVELALSPMRRVPQPVYLGTPPPSPDPEDEHFWSDNEPSHEVENQQPQPSGANRASLSGEERFAVDFSKSGVHFLSALKDFKEAQANDNGRKGKDKETDQRQYDTSDYGDDSMDEEMLESIAAAEKEAYTSKGRIGVIPPSSDAAARSSSSTINPRSPPHISQGPVVDVITIDDDDTDSDRYDKENVPVPTRHVRRRTEDRGRGGLGGSQRAREAGRPVILARRESDVINISDSD